MQCVDCRLKRQRIDSFVCEALLLCFRVEEVDFFRSVLAIGVLAF